MEAITGFCITISRVVLGLMMLLISSDVVLRYVFNRPIRGSFELIEFMMVAVVFLGLGYTQVKKGHLSITLLVKSLPENVTSIINTATNLLSGLIFLAIAWQNVLQTMESRATGGTSAVLEIPTFPFYLLVAFGSVLLGLVFLMDFIASLIQVRKKCSAWLLWLLVDAVAVVAIVMIPWIFEWVPWELSRPVVGVLCVILMMVLLFANMPIGPVMALVGFLGFTFLVNWDAALAILGTSPFSTGANQPLSTIPLFVLMGVFCFYSEISTEIYETIRTWLGRLPGGLAMTTVGACTGFAAVSGSSLATTITMGTIALPEMKKNHYSDALACGTIAAGGTFGIMIPPSVPLIIYASLAEESIGKLFMAGIFPGILAAVLYIFTIFVITRLRPEMGPPGVSTSFREKIVSLKGTWGILVLFILVIGGIYLGVFTPTEAAGVGAFGALLLGLFKKKLTQKKILLSLADAAHNTTLLLLMMVGANIFSYFLTMSQIPFLLSETVTSLPVPGVVTMWAILLIYIVLGCIMPIIPIIVLTVPIFLPVVVSLGYDPVWFGIMMVIMAEIGQITPPIGINCITLSGVAQGVQLSTIYRGIGMFLVADIVRMILVFFIPGIALWIPHLMY